MPVVISAGAGTWSPIPGMTAENAGLNVPSIRNIDLEGLKGIHGVVHEELRQFIQLVADGYGLKFWQGAGLVEVLLKALMNSEGPTQQNRYTP